jgi:hypothetical protein
MAVSTGVGPHLAFITLNGNSFPVTDGSVDQKATRKSSSFSVNVPMSFPGALDAFTNISQKQQVTIIVSTRGQQATLLTGVAEHVDFKFTARQITVHGHDESAMLHTMKVSQKFQNQTGSQIVQTLAAMAGLSVQAGSSALMAGKITNSDYAKLADNISIAAILHKVSEFDGARWLVQNGTLFYQLQDEPSGVYTLNYVAPTEDNPMSADSLDLSVVLNVPVNDGGTFMVKSWHPRQAQAFQGQATYGNGGSNQYVIHIPNLLQDHAQQHAQSKANELGKNAVTVRAHVVGDPTINIMMDLQVNGTDAFDATYQMDSITHHFGYGGHTMDLVARVKSGSNSGAAGGPSTVTTSATTGAVVPSGAAPGSSGGIGRQ